MKQTTLLNAIVIAVPFCQNNSGEWVHATAENVTHRVVLVKTATGSYTHNNIHFIPCSYLGTHGYQIFVDNVLNGVIWDKSSIGKRLADIMNTNNKAKTNIETW